MGVRSYADSIAFALSYTSPIMKIPTIREDIIRHHATAQSFSRGETYYQNGAVTALTQRGNVLMASVEGSDLEPYHTTIQFDAGGITQASCTCPYDFEGWCKHIVATLLRCVHQPHTIEARPTLEQLLDRLNHVQTQRLIQELVAEQPNLIDAIDYHVNQIITPVSTPKPAKVPRQTAIDPAPFRRQVKQILREGLRYLEEGWEEDPISDALIEVIDKAQAFTEQGDGNSAIVILEAITSTCANEFDDLANYGADTDAISDALNDAWTEAILTAELTEEQKVDLEVMLQEWQDLLDTNFDMSLAALHQGWDYPPLQQVLQGNITERGIWEGEPPHYADDLALIRLHILDRQGRNQEYLYLAEAEQQTTQYLTKLASVGQVEMAIAHAKTQITTPEQAYALAQTLREQNRLAEALDIAQHGLALPDVGHYDLADWTSDLAEGLGEAHVALDARVLAFNIRPSFKDYRMAEILAGEQWSAVKPDLLATLRRDHQWNTVETRVDIFLHEGLVDDAIHSIPTENYYYAHYRTDLVHRVMDAALPHRPEWVLTTARNYAEPIMDAKKSERYREAIDWLKRVKAAYFQLDQQTEWTKYRTQITEKYGRLRKLMELLKQAGL